MFASIVYTPINEFGVFSSCVLNSAVVTLVATQLPPYVTNTANGTGEDISLRSSVCAACLLIALVIELGRIVALVGTVGLPILASIVVALDS